MDMDKVVRRKQLLQMIGVSAATQYRMEKAGLFPARFKLARGLVGWHLTEVEEWLRNRERVAEPAGGGPQQNGMVGTRVDGGGGTARPDSDPGSERFRP